MTEYLHTYISRLAFFLPFPLFPFAFEAIHLIYHWFWAAYFILHFAHFTFHISHFLFLCLLFHLALLIKSHLTIEDL